LSGESVITISPERGAVPLDAAPGGAGTDTPAGAGTGRPAIEP